MPGSNGFVVNIREPQKPPLRVTITDPIEVGREGTTLVVSDLGVSRRHLRLSMDAGRLVVADLGSSNGTFVNGVRVNGQAVVNPGDTIRLGGTEIQVIGPEEVESPAATVPARVGGVPAQVPPPPQAQPPQAVARRPALEELASKSNDAAVIRFRPGTMGERLSDDLLSAAKRARQRLRGLGSEPWGVAPQIVVVDSFPDPQNPGEVVTAGTVVDAAHGEIWMVATPESPPEPLERPLAIFFGASLPGAEDIGPLLEGYGLHVADVPDPNPTLREMPLPPLAAAPDELRPVMSLSFVRWLIERGGQADFLRMLSSVQPNRLDIAAEEVYGAGLAKLEESWLGALMAGPPSVKAGQFLRLTLRYLRPHVRREIEMFVYMMLGLAFTIVFPFIFRRLLDQAIPSGRFAEVLTLLGILGIVFAISLLAGLRRAYLSAVVSGSVVRQIRVDMFQKLQALPAAWFHRHEEGDVLSRFFSDVAELEAGLSETLREGLFQFLSLVVSAAVLVVLNPLLGLITLAGAPIIAVVYRSMAAGAQKRSVAVQEQNGAVLSVASENYNAQPVVRAFSLAARELSRFRRASDRLFERQVKLHLFGGLFNLSVNMIVVGLRIVVLGLGAWLIFQGNLTVGGLVAFMSLMGEAISPVTVLTGIGQQLQASTGALVRINEVMDEVPSIADVPNAVELPPLSREIRLTGVGFSYTTDKKTLEGIDVTIPAGSRVAFVGPSGAGKSSILQLLMRFYDVDEGAVLFDGRDIREVTLESLRGQMGVVFQDTFLFATTVGENLRLGKPGATDAEIDAASKAAELHDFVMTLPRGYDTPVGERGGRLSGGQRQRLAIARALLRDPRVLLLDEATSALDPKTERLIARTLQNVARGRTTIAVTHRLTSITDYDRIFVIVAGKLAEQGTHDELLANGGVYAELWEEQTGGRVAVEAPFDPVAALSNIPIFSGVPPGGLQVAASKMQAITLSPGETMEEGKGDLLIVRSGRAHVLTPAVDGRLVPVSELTAGDAFGVAALLGKETGSVVRAVEAVNLLVLDDEAISGLAARFPSVADHLSGARPPQAAPAGGTRLSRVTIGPSSLLSGVSVAPSRPAPHADQVRRLTGAMPVVRP